MAVGGPAPLGSREQVVIGRDGKQTVDYKSGISSMDVNSGNSIASLVDSGLADKYKKRNEELQGSSQIGTAMADAAKYNQMSLNGFQATV